jgi:hypothetical protein
MGLKQIYIPSLRVRGTYIEELGGESDRVLYPGEAFELDLSEKDFENKEDYHSTWIAVTNAVKKKLNEASGEH